MNNYAKRFLKPIIFQKSIFCFWSKSNNWGDALNPYLIKKISGKDARFEANEFFFKNLVIGSILHRADQYSTVWGTGMISPSSLPAVKPLKICAVRGLLTREKLLHAGLSCPDVYGDPALLLPRFYNPKREIKWKVGVIPHYADQDHSWITKIKNIDGVHIIDINHDTEYFINEVLSCECILSSSLHGLICADAYGIPSRWIELSDRVVGNGFKFRDYYSSINCSVDTPFEVKANTEISEILNSIDIYSLDIDLDALYNSCPFRKL